jgi:alpha-glucosidase
MQTTDRRPFLLSRSGAAGSQRYGASPWSGDVGATWSDLRRQTHLLLSASTCGVGLWGCDVGGFAGEPRPELFARWVQLGTWLPVMRAHGCMSDREPWSQGSEALEAVRPSITLRGQLLPSIASWAQSAFAQGLPLTRPMWMDYPDDEQFSDLADQWMFGPLLVAPVLTEGAQSRSVVLPDGEWVDLWTGTRHVGGTTIKVEVALGSNPAFIRTGSILVVDPTPSEHRAMQWPPAELEAWVFADEDGRAEGQFTLDDGLTRRHERGAYASVNLHAVEGNLSVERVAGSFPMVPIRIAPARPGIQS